MPNTKFNYVAAEIKKRVESSQYSTTQKLPSEYDLSKEFGVSRLTVRKAIELLVAEKVLVKDPGKGTYILTANQKIASGRMGLQGFTEVANAAGKKPRAEILSFSALHDISKELKEMLAVDDEQVKLLVRRRFLDDEPMTVEQVKIKAQFLNDYQPNDFKESLFHILEEQGISIAYSHQEIEAVLADKEFAKLLAVPSGAPLLKIMSIMYTVDAKPIFFDTSYYRADKYTVKSTLTRYH